MACAVAAVTVLNHVAQLATFVERSIELHVFDASGAKWKARGQR